MLAGVAVEGGPARTGTASSQLTPSIAEGFRG